MPLQCPRYNYAAQFGPEVDTLLGELRGILLGGNYILSAEVSRFEQTFASYTNCQFARGVNSGTDALLISLMALGVGKGDEVITQANTFHATVAAVQLAGATPVLVDADEDSFLMDVTQVPAAVTDRTRVLLPVHLYGKPTDLSELLRIAKPQQLHLVEDAAQAHGASINGQQVGGIGTAGCFSFHPSKNLAAAGDAGAIVSNDRMLVERIDCLRSLGQKGQNDHVVVGVNSKLDAVQASILSWKLGRLDEWNRARERVADAYRVRLEDLPLTFQRTDPDERHVYHLFQVRTKRRAALLAHLRRNGVDAVVRYPIAVPHQPAFAHWGWRPGQFPVAERLANELLCLPMRPDMQEAEVEYVCRRVRDFFNREGNAQ